MFNIKDYTTIKEIATISPESLNNGTLYQFMTSVLNYAVANEKIAEEAHLKPLVQSLTTALTKENKIEYNFIVFLNQRQYQTAHPQTKLSGTKIFSHFSKSECYYSDSIT